MTDNRVTDTVVASTDRLVLRPWRHAEVEAMYDLYRREEVWRWLGAQPAPPASVEAMHATVDRWAGRAEGPYGVWAVEPVALGAPVGTVLLVPLPDADGRPTDDVEVGWHLHPDHWGHGYATEAARALLARAWDAGLSEVYAVVHPANERSVAVTRRLGMAPIGLTDRWYGVQLAAFRAGRPAP